MTADEGALVPVWTLTTEDVNVPDVTSGGAMTPECLGEIRTVLAALADSPIATSEAHPISAGSRRTGGIALHATSPLVTALSQLSSQTARSAPAAATAVASGEVLYRMVVPAKVAAQVGKGLMRPMASKATAGVVHSALVNSSGIASQATFVPVTGQAAAAGAATGAASTAGVAAASAGALTVAAPLVLMAVAVGVSAYADHHRQQAIERITELLEKVHENQIESERSELEGCRDAIDKATAVLLDQGRIGASLGLDSASHAISKATEAARRRLGRWERALTDFGEGPIELARLKDKFEGIDEENGEFQAHLELAALAIALKRRVIVLQAVEHAQADDGPNPFTSFMRVLRADHERVDELERGIAQVLYRLSTLQLDRSHGIRDFMFSSAEVDKLLRASYRLRELGADVSRSEYQPDVAIEIERRTDGSVIVFPASAA